MEKLQLVIEKAVDGQLWGRVTYDDNLLVDAAETLEDLKIQMKSLLFDFHEVDPTTIEFEVGYDLTAFFDTYSFLKASKIAEKAGINPSLVRHYSAGTKKPSADQVKRIEVAVHQLADELRQVHLV